jgi:hypothetical protein
LCRGCQWQLAIPVALLCRGVPNVVGAVARPHE